MKWTQEQQAVIQSFGQGQAVIAGAGCGKTSTLVAKCEAFLDRFPAARVLAISFTERSAEDLRLKLTQAGILNPQSRHWVGTIHGFCSEVLRQFPEQAGVVGDEAILSEYESQDAWIECVESLWEQEESATGVSDAWKRWLEREHFDRIPELLATLRVERITAECLGGEDFARYVASVRQNQDLEFAADLERVVSQRYEEMLSRRGQQDFFALEWRAVRATAELSVQSYYRQSLDLVLVDEFQDTNRLQGRLVEQILRPDFSNVCVVGDPKQSIYRFRGAEVRVFDGFRSKLAVHQTLSVNFRSRPEIIHFINSVCAPVFEQLAMEYHALVPGLPELEPHERPDRPAVRIHVAGEGIHQGVLLLRRLRGREDWIRGIEQTSKLNIHLPQGGALQDQPIVREVMGLCRWLCWPAARRSAGTVLRAPWFGLPWSEVLSWESPETGVDLERYFTASHPWSARLLAFRNARGSHRFSELLQAEWLTQAWSESEKIWIAVLRENFLARELRGETATEALEAIERDLKRGNRHPEIPPDLQEGLVALTVHGSKGLEFDSVVLADFPERPKRIEMPLLYQDRVLGLFLAHRDPTTGERVKNDPLEAPFRENERLEQVRESARLFYVALTRAKEELVLWDDCDASEQGAVSIDDVSDQVLDHWRLWIDAHLRTLRHGAIARQQVTADALAGGGPSDIAIPIRKPIRWARNRQSVSEWQWADRCPRGYAAHYLEGALHPSEAPDEAQQFGTQVHARLARLWTDQNNALPEPYESQVQEWQQILESEYPGWRWFPELALEVPLDGESTFVGVVDLVGQDPETGDIRFWDYKVTQDRSRFMGLEAFKSRYGLQLHAYRWALEQLEPNGRIVGVEGVIFSPDRLERVSVLTDERDDLGDSAGAVAYSSAKIAQIATEFAQAVELEERLNPACCECPARTQCESFLSSLQADSLPL